MKIQNVRLGHATNSSSAHSIIFSPRETPPARAWGSTDCRYSRYSFGWERFVLDTVEDKLDYLAVALYQKLNDKLGKDMALAAIKELFPLTDDSIVEGYIDHESTFQTPGVGEDDFPTRVRELIEFFSDERVTIYGGNDNGYEGEDYYVPGVGEIEVPKHLIGTLRVRRDDRKTPAYVLYNPRTGAKVRLSDGEYSKSSVPELVDLKITNYCPYGCAFCYQGSTKQGYDAEERDLFSVIHALATLGVLEVAMGGGEPPLSKNFVSTVRACSSFGITPNFTCFGTEWLTDPERVEVARLCRGIGVSVHAEREVKKVLRIRDVLDSSAVTVSAQHVVGTVPGEELRRLIKACAQGDSYKDVVPLLLLGYKNVGFGPNFTPYYVEDELTRALSDHRLRLRLSVDTAFVDQFPSLLTKLAVPHELITSPEGKFSCYIDAVEGKIAPSSYCPPKDMIPLKTLQLEKRGALPSTFYTDFAEEIKRVYATF